MSAASGSTRDSVTGNIRGDFLLGLALYWRQAGSMTAEELLAVLKIRNAKKCDPPLSEANVRLIVAAACISDFRDDALPWLRAAIDAMADGTQVPVQPLLPPLSLIR